MNETRLDTIGKVEQFLSACAPIEFSTSGDDSERFAPSGYGAFVLGGSLGAKF